MSMEHLAGLLAKIERQRDEALARVAELIAENTMLRQRERLFDAHGHDVPAAMDALAAAQAEAAAERRARVHAEVERDTTDDLLTKCRASRARMEPYVAMFRRIEAENLDLERRANFEQPGFRWWVSGQMHKRHVGQGDTLADAFADLDAHADEASTRVVCGATPDSAAPPTVPGEPERGPAYDAATDTWDCSYCAARHQYARRGKCPMCCRVVLYPTPEGDGDPEMLDAAAPPTVPGEPLTYEEGDQ